MQIKTPEPKKQSEFEVQAHIWVELRKLGINARGEVKTPFLSDSKRKQMCRFDVAVFEEGFMVSIIEIKAGVRKHKTAAGWAGTRQGARYGMFGVPVLIIYGQEQANDFIAQTIAAGQICWKG